MTKRNKKQQPVDHLAQNNAFLREVDETMRMDRMTELWLQYRTIFFLTLGAIFCLFAAHEYYTQSQETKLNAQAEAYWSMVRQDSGVGVEADFQELAENGAEGYRLLAQFQIARQLTQSGKMDEAVSIYKQVSDNESNMPIYRDLALYYAAQLLMDSEMAQAQSMFTQLVESQSAYRASSLEMLGALSESQGDMATAKSYYETAYGTPGLPQGLRSRVKSRLDVIERVLNAQKI